MTVQSAQVRVISLAADVERRSAFVADAVGAHIEWHFFDAYTSLHAGLYYDPEEVLVRRGRRLTQAELGCYSSHYAVWQEFLASDTSVLVVIEDDTWVDWNFLEKMVEEDVGAVGIDYLRLACLNLPPTMLKGKILGRYVAHFLGYPQGTQGYMLTKNGARHLSEYCRRVTGPIDIVIDQTWRGSLPALAVFPGPIIEKAVPSRIGIDRYDPVGELPASLWLRRQLYRIKEKVLLKSYRVKCRAGFGPNPALDRRWI